MARSPLAACGCGSWRGARACPKRCLRGGKPRFFAMGLIAAKPVKPCDGGVFRAFYLLLKKERHTHRKKAPLPNGCLESCRRMALAKTRALCKRHALLHKATHWRSAFKGRTPHAESCAARLDSLLIQ